MAYMRGNPYIYASSAGLEIHVGNQWCVLSMEDAEDLAVMIVGELIMEEQFDSVVDRAVSKHGGNFGCEVLTRYKGGPAWAERVEAIIKANRDSAKYNEEAIARLKEDYDPPPSRTS